MKRLVTIIAILFVAQMAVAQVDTKAKGILDQVSAKNKGYKSIYAEVSYSLSNSKSGVASTKSLKVHIKGAKYNIDTGDQLVISDGKSVWKYYKDENQADWDNVDASEDGLTPQNMFTIYQKGFKYKFVKEETPKGGKAQYIIDLFPENPKSKDYTSVKLTIDKAELRITKADVVGRNGSTYSYKIKTFTPNKAMADDMFTFDKTKYPKVVINDVR